VKTYHPVGGEDIYATAGKMVSEANAFGESVQAVFNEFRLCAQPGQDPAEIVRAYHEDLNRGVQESRNKRDAQIAKLETALRQVKAIVVGEKNPNWRDQDATTWSRGQVADICDVALGLADNPECGE